MVGRNLHEDQHKPVWIGDAKLDQPPGLGRCALEDLHPGRTELLLCLPDVPNLQPQLRRACWRIDLLIRELQATAPEEEHDAAGITSAKLSHGMQAENITVETEAAIEIAGVEHEPAGQNLHGARLRSLHCPRALSGYIRRASLA